MLTISDELKAKYTDGEAHDVQCYIEFYNTIDMETVLLTLDNSSIISEKFEIQEDLCSGDDLSLGDVCTTQLTFQGFGITNTLVGKYIKVYQKVDGLDEEMPLGRYIVRSVEKATQKSRKVVTAYDYTVLFDEDATALQTALEAATTIGEALTVVSSRFGLEWASTSYTGWDYPFTYTIDADSAGSYTCRDIVAMLAQLLGGWIRMTREGKLELVTIGAPDTDSMESITYLRSNPQYEEYLVKSITNVRYTGLDETVYNASTDDTNILDVSNNIFLSGMTEDNINSILSLILANVSSINFYPCEMEFDARPYLEIGDYIKFTDDETVYYTLIKSRTLSGIMAQVDDISADGAEDTALSYTALSQSTSVIGMVRRENYERKQAVESLAAALASSSGMYVTEVEASGGGTIYYIHDKNDEPDSDGHFSESTIVLKLTSEAIGISQDGGVTYPYGTNFLTGDTIVNVLEAVGVNADWITAGALTILDADGNIIAKFDADAKTAQIAGWNIENGKIVSYDATAEFNSEVDALMFYNSSGTLVMKINNNGVYNYDNNGTLRSILALNYLQFYTSDATKRIQFDSDGIDFYDLDGGVFGTLGFSTLYKTDSSGNITNEVNGYILGEKVYNDSQAMGWGIMAWKEDASQYQRRLYYCNQDEGDYTKDNFYINCETQGLRHTEVDPYYVSHLTWTSTGFTITISTLTGAKEDTTNDFTIAYDSSGNVSQIVNAKTGHTLTIDGY